MQKILISFLSVLFITPTWAQIRDLQTARLNSAAGTGVGSILMTEGSILNPASSAFFNGTSVSYQSTSVSLKSENSLRDTTNREWKSPRNQAVFASDHGGDLKGGMSYQDQRENGFSRTRYTMHGAGLIADNISFGALYRYTEDERPDYYSNKSHKTFHQIVLGTTVILAKDLTLGIVYVDPGKTNKLDERLLTGFQYNVTDRLALLADVGWLPTRSFESRYQWSAAVQFNPFADLYLRAGKFYDHITFLEGSGWGVSWVGPKLGLEFAQKYTEKMSDKYTYIFDKEKIVDTTLSAIIRF